MKIFRIYIVSLLIVLFLLSDFRISSAIEPLTAYIAASALIHVVVAAGGYVYAKYSKRDRPAGSHSVTSAGDVGRSAGVTWVDLTDGSVSNPSKSISASVKYDDIKNKARSTPSKYPLLDSATKKKDYTESSDIDWSNPSSNVGKVLYVSSSNYYPLDRGKRYLVGSLKGQTTDTYYGTPAFTFAVTYNTSEQTLYVTRFTYNSPSNYTRNQLRYSLAGSAVEEPPLIDSSGSEFNAVVNDGSGYLKSEYRGEIDDMIQSNPNIVDYKDTEDPQEIDTAPPYVLPSPPDFSALLAAMSKASSDAAAKAYADGRAALEAAIAAATAGYNNNPTFENEARLRELQAALAALLAEIANRETEDIEETFAPGVVPSPYGGGSPSDIQGRFSQFFTDVKSTSLFSLPNQLLSGLPSGGSPVMTVDCGRWGVKSIDFSTMSDLLSVIRTVFLIAFSFVAIKILVLKGGGG